MSRNARVFVLAAGLVVSSLAVTAGPAQAASPSSRGAAAASRSHGAHHRKVKRPVPIIAPGVDQTVAVGTELTFTGSGSFDPDGGAVRFEWRSTGVRKIASRDASYTRTFDSPGRFMVKLRVIDDEGQRAARKVWITVIAASPEPPVAVLKPKKELNLEIGATIAFDGTKSFDPDGGAVTFEWRVTKPLSDEPELVSRDPKYVHTFSELGAGQAVSLTVIDDEGERTTIVKPVTVYVVDRFGRGS